jgi:hypothetical protein
MMIHKHYDRKRSFAKENKTLVVDPRGIEAQNQLIAL